MMISAVHFGIHALFCLDKRNKGGNGFFKKISVLPIMMSDNTTKVVQKGMVGMQNCCIPDDCHILYCAALDQL